MANIIQKLWQKDGDESSDCYVDLFDDVGHAKTPITLKRLAGKSNTVADNHRNAGNAFFAQKKWSEAIEEYNQSLCHAETGTEPASLAYANRSNCFRYLGKYDNCLRDIELAIQANYPQRLMAKLEQRKADCVKSKAADKKVRSKPIELSYSESANIPGMASTVKLVRNAEFGRHIVAVEDIPVNKTILVEPYFISNTSTSTSTSSIIYCTACHVGKCNLIPCAKCTTAMFCSEACLGDSPYHVIGCGYTYNEVLEFTPRLILRSILTGLDAFESVNDFMEFIEIVRIEDADVPTLTNDPKSRYRAFLQLNINPFDASRMDRIVFVADYAFRYIKLLPEMAHLFETLAKERFFMHLITMHAMLVRSNLSNHSMNHGKSINSISLVFSLINHQCLPNVVHYNCDGKHACTTIRPIKKGEQLFVTYVPYSLNNRRRVLHDLFGFWCKCTKCVPVAFKPYQKALMEHDADFLALLRLLMKYFPIPDVKERTLIKNHCVKFLNRFGHLPCNYILEEITQALVRCISLENGY